MTQAPPSPPSAIPPPEENSILTFHNPYKGLIESDLEKLTVRVSRSEAYLKLVGIRPGRDTIQNTLGLLIQKLVHQLEKRNITTINDDKRLEQFLALCEIGLPGEILGLPLTNTNVQGGKDSLHGTPTTRVDTQTNTPTQQRGTKTRTGEGKKS